MARKWYPYLVRGSSKRDELIITKTWMHLNKIISRGMLLTNLTVGIHSTGD